MTEREQFEAWAKARYAKNPHFWLRQIDDGGYSCGMADSAWNAWQAVRAQPAQAGQVPSDVVRDARRYRWLRNESWAGYNTGRGTPSVYTVDGAGNRRLMLAEEAMDEAIDAAMAQGEKP